MDKTTFTNSKAAINLATMLDTPEYTQYRDRVNRILSRWFEYSSEVMAIKSPTVCLGTLDKWRTHFKEWVDNSELPEVVRSHAHNVLAIQYRKCKAIIDARAKEIARQKRLPKEAV